jgi:hypothetical protein
LICLTADSTIPPSPQGREPFRGKYELHESTGLFEKRSAVAVGKHVKTHRNVRWLPWIPGKISYVDLEGDDMLTGPMSGCYIVVFEFENRIRVGHIGTSQGRDHPDTI